MNKTLKAVDISIQSKPSVSNVNPAESGQKASPKKSDAKGGGSGSCSSVEEDKGQIAQLNSSSDLNVLLRDASAKSEASSNPKGGESVRNRAVPNDSRLGALGNSSGPSKNHALKQPRIPDGRVKVLQGRGLASLNMIGHDPKLSRQENIARLKEGMALPASVTAKLKNKGAAPQADAGGKGSILNELSLDHGGNANRLVIPNPVVQNSINSINYTKNSKKAKLTYSQPATDDPASLKAWWSGFKEKKVPASTPNTTAKKEDSQEDVENSVASRDPTSTVDVMDDSEGASKTSKTASSATRQAKSGVENNSRSEDSPDAAHVTRATEPYSRGRDSKDSTEATVENPEAATSPSKIGPVDGNAGDLPATQDACPGKEVANQTSSVANPSSASSSAPVPDAPGSAGTSATPTSRGVSPTSQPGQRRKKAWGPDSASNGSAPNSSDSPNKRASAASDVSSAKAKAASSLSNVGRVSDSSSMNLEVNPGRQSSSQPNAGESPGDAEHLPAQLARDSSDYRPNGTSPPGTPSERRSRRSDKNSRKDSKDEDYGALSGITTPVSDANLKGDMGDIDNRSISSKEDKDGSGSKPKSWNSWSKPERNVSDDVQPDDTTSDLWPALGAAAKKNKSPKGSFKKKSSGNLSLDNGNEPRDRTSSELCSNLIVPARNDGRSVLSNESAKQSNGDAWATPLRGPMDDPSIPVDLNLERRKNSYLSAEEN